MDFPETSFCYLQQQVITEVQIRLLEEQFKAQLDKIWYICHRPVTRFSVFYQVSCEQTRQPFSDYFSHVQIIMQNSGPKYLFMFRMSAFFLQFKLSLEKPNFVDSFDTWLPYSQVTVRCGCLHSCLKALFYYHMKLFLIQEQECCTLWGRKVNNLHRKISQEVYNTWKILIHLLLGKLQVIDTIITSMDSNISAFSINYRDSLEQLLVSSLLPTKWYACSYILVVRNE